MQGCERDHDLGNRRGGRLEALAHRIEIGQPAGVQLGIDAGGEFGLADSFVSRASNPTTVWQACLSLPLANSASKARAKAGRGNSWSR